MFASMPFVLRCRCPKGVRAGTPERDLRNF
jgi:hypothetical protein